MAAAKMSLKEAQRIRNKTIKDVTDDIDALYKRIEKNQNRQAQLLSNKESLSATSKKKIMSKQGRQLEREIAAANRIIDKQINDGVRAIAAGVTKANNEFLRNIGLRLAQNIFGVSDKVVKSIIRGEIYGTPEYLSKTIWSLDQFALRQIESVIAKGILKGKGMKDIAQDLGKFVKPSSAKAAKTITWVDKATGKIEKYYPGRVDYNANRLARTMFQHAYQQSLHENLDKCPFLIGYRWIANGSRACPLCDERDGQIFKPDELPLDHPNGMCDFEPIFEDVNVMTSRLANWAHGTKDPELDNWAADFD